MRPRASSSVTVPLHELHSSKPRVSVGPYELVAPLARGGTGAVYLAEHRGTHERVALKLLHPAYAGNIDIVERLFAERDISATVQHRALLDVRAADTTSTGLPYLVMEYLDGENLGALAERGRLEIDAVVAIGIQIASALTALHDAGFIHCDIKPDNILVLYQQDVDGWPRVKVIDYGVAVQASTEPARADTIAGTPAYMAPEQWRGSARRESDLYALGCTLYELLVGEQPFHGTLPELMQAHTEQLAERPSFARSQIPAGLDRLVTRLLSKDPALRPTAAEVGLELAKIAQQLAPSVELVAAG